MLHTARGAHLVQRRLHHRTVIRYGSCQPVLRRTQNGSWSNSSAERSIHRLLLRVKAATNVEEESGEKKKEETGFLHLRVRAASVHLRERTGQARARKSQPARARLREELQEKLKNRSLGKESSLDQLITAWEKACQWVRGQLLTQDLPVLTHQTKA